MTAAVLRADGVMDAVPICKDVVLDPEAAFSRRAAGWSLWLHELQMC